MRTNQYIFLLFKYNIYNGILKELIEKSRLSVYIIYMETNQLTQSLEDYLEAIYNLESKKRVARVKEIAETLNVKMPSVSGALKNLKNKGLIDYEKNSYITLTETGEKIARTIDRKHQILDDFLRGILKLNEEEAAEKACQIEHIIDLKTALRIDNLNSFLREKHAELVESSDWEHYLALERE